MKKSTIKKLKEIDFEKEIIIEEIKADQKIVEEHFQRLKSILKDKEPDEQIWKRINSIVIRDNIFNAAMERIVQAFEFDFDEQEITEMAKRMRTFFADRKDEVVREIATKMLIKELIFDALAKEWKIEVSDEEVNKALESYSKFANQPIDSKIHNKEEYENVRQMILEEKLANLIIQKIKYRIDLKNMKPAATEAEKAEKAEKAKAEAPKAKVEAPKAKIKTEAPKAKVETPKAKAKPKAKK